MQRCGSTTADRRRRSIGFASSCPHGDLPTPARVRRVSPAGGGADARGEAGGRGVRAQRDRCVPDGRAARAVGSAGRRWRTSTACSRWPRRPASSRARSTRTSFRTRLQARFVRHMSTRPCARAGARARPRERRDRRGARQPRRLVLVRRRVELSGHREHPRAQALVRGRTARDARAPRARPAAARRVQAVRAGVLPHGHRRLGHGPAARARGRAVGARCSSTPATTTRRRTSSRSSRGSSPSGMLGGFHFNDRRYADDDLTIGSIDPYQVFRIFHEIRVLRVGDGRAGRHRVRDRPEPQPEGQDRGDDPDGRHGAGARSPRRRSSTIARLAAAQRANDLVAGRDVPAGRLRDRRAAGDRGVAAVQGLPVDPLDGVPRERLSRSHHAASGTRDRLDLRPGRSALG